MATTVNNGDLIQLRVWTLQAEQAAVNTVYYLAGTNTGTPVSDNDFGVKFDSIVAPIMKSAMSTDVSYRGVQYNIVQRTPLPATGFVVASVGAGGESPPDCPRQTSLPIQWRTALAGKRYRGHWYQPFPSTGNVATDGVPTAAYQTLMSNLATAILGMTFVSNAGSLGTMSCALVIHHRPGKTPTPTVTPVTGYIIPAKFGTQKRRGAYGRPNASPI